MRSFVTFLSLFTLLFFLAPVLCLGITPTVPQNQTETAVESLPEQISYQGKTVSTADFLVGMLAEMDLRGYRDEAIRAAAVVATTQLTVAYQTTGTADGLTVQTAEEAKKAWGDYWFSQYWPQLQQAVSTTWGQRLIKEGELYSAKVFPVSWGQTAEGIQCPYDFTSNDYERTVKVSLEAFALVFPEYTHSLTVKKAQSGRVETVTSGKGALSGTEVAAKFDLPSPSFSIAVTQSAAVFTCYGNGNGEGMSLYAANELAKRGESYQAILAYFYPDATLSGT